MSARRARFVLEPRVAVSVPAGIVGIEVDEAAMDLPIADLEHVAPAAGAPLGNARTPGAVVVLAVARAFADQDVAAREHPVEVREVVLDRLQRGAHIAEQLADPVAASGHAPLRKVDLRVAREQVEDRAAAGGYPAVVERLQVLERDRLALLVGHGLSCQGHGRLLRWRPPPGQRVAPVTPRVASGP